MANVKAYYVVSMDDKGIVTTYPGMPEEGLEAERPITNYDIYTASKQIVEEFESSILAQKVADTVMAVLGQPAQDVPAAVKEALKERGIQTDSE